MRTFKASYKKHIFKGQLWRFARKHEVLVSRLPQLAAEYFIRPHPVPTTDFPSTYHSWSLHPHQSILHLGPVQEPMNEGFLEPQGGLGDSPLSLSQPWPWGLLWGTCLWSEMFSLLGFLP